MHRLIPCLLLLSLLCATGASAGDGRTEISQASVLAGGGFPFVISASGSYVLTSDLIVSDPDADAIQIGVDDVSLDLNGFTIRGPVGCTGGTGGVTLSCTPSGQGSAIVSDDINNNSEKRSNLIVRNGTIRGFAQHGVLFFFTDSGFLLEDVTIAETGFFAALVEGAVVRNTVLRASRELQILNGVASEISAFEIAGNFAANGTVVANSNISGGNGNGVSAGVGVVVDSSIRNNEGLGISCSSCLANGNAIDGNGLSGLAISGSLGFDGGYTNNVINDHPGGDPVSGGIYMSPNLCDGSTAPNVCDPL